MSKRTLICYLLLFSARFVFAQQAPTASPQTSPTASGTSGTAKPLRDLVSQLDQAGLQKVIKQLRSIYVDSNALTNQEINQAAVEGLLSRLGPGATLQAKTQTGQPEPNKPFKSELIETLFGYVRLGS